MNSFDALKRLSDYPRPLVVMGIGVPGARKSELLKNLERIPDLSAIHLSPSKVQARLAESNNSAFDGLDLERKEAKIRRHLYSTAASYLSDGLGVSVIYDADNADHERRREDVQMFREEFGARAIIGVSFSVDTDVALERLGPVKSLFTEQRMQRFWDSRRMLLKNPPCIEEGFNEIIPIDTTDTAAYNRLMAMIRSSF